MFRRSFWSCRSGNVGLIFALAIIPVMGSIGLAIDYSTAVSARYRLQNAIDATALSLAHADPKLTQAQLDARAKLVFAQNFKDDSRTTLGPIITVRGDDYVTVNATAQTKTTFSRILNVNTLNVGSAGKVVWGPVRVEVVLALDNTYSMNDDGKMTELKSAAKTLVDTLEKVETKEGDVKIGIAPFGSFVRVDPATYKTAAWIDFPSKTVCTKTKNGKCTESSQVAFDKANWKGCIEDRTQDYDVNDTYSASVAASKYPAVENADCVGTAMSGTNMDQTRLAAIRPLGWDFDAIRTAVKNMTPVGTTNVTIGFQWAMSLLSYTEPFTEGVNPANEKTDGKTEKVIILLTDGDNTENRWNTYSSSNDTKIDPRTKLACAEAKKTATVYTIRLGNEGNASMLRTCASDTAKYFDVEDVDALTPVFQGIADEISKLRVAS